MTETAPSPLFICPFCGGKTPDQPRCGSCNGPLDPLSRQATQNSMGPWFIRDELHPFRPGCSYDTVVAMIYRGKITPESILRGPTTAQFWYPAKRVPGVAHRLGLCHSCQAGVDASEVSCPRCAAEFHADPDRQLLGLMPVRLVPGQGQTLAETQDPEIQEEPSAAAPVPRKSVADGRLEGEIAELRKRVGLLIAVAGVCVLVAVIALVLAAAKSANSGTPSGGGASPSASPTGRNETASPADAHASMERSRAKGLSGEEKAISKAQTQIQPRIEEQPLETGGGVSPPAASPSMPPALVGRLRATMWP